MKVYERTEPYRPCTTDDFGKKTNKPVETRLAKGAGGRIMPYNQAVDSLRWQREERQSALVCILALTIGLPFLLVLVVLAAFGIIQCGNKGNEQ